MNVLATLLTIVMNGLANALPLNGQLTGEISDRFKVFFVPAGYVFSIWGIIYLGLIVFSIYQVLPAQRENPDLRKVGYFYVVSCVANIIWLFLWHYNIFLLTLVAMLAILYALITIYQRLAIGKARPTASMRMFVHLPFSIYLGWITVATITNATSLLEFLGWNGWGIGPAVWAAIMLIAAVAISTLMSFTRGDIAYVVVLVWVFAGIAAKHWVTPAVGMTAILSALVVIVTLILGRMRLKGARMRRS
jgi:benzodiazapine receptor